MTTPTDTRAEGEAVLEHLRHMAEVRPQGLDRDAAEWALERIATLSAQLAEAQGKIERYETALEQVVDDFGIGYSVCDDTKQLCIAALSSPALWPLDGGDAEEPKADC